MRHAQIFSIVFVTILVLLPQPVFGQQRSVGVRESEETR